MRQLVFLTYSILGAFSLPFVKEVFLVLFTVPGRKVAFSKRRLIIAAIMLYFLFSGMIMTRSEIGPILNDASIFLVILIFCLLKNRFYESKNNQFFSLVAIAFLILTTIHFIIHLKIFYVLDERSRLILPYGSAAGALFATVITTSLLFQCPRNWLNITLLFFLSAVIVLSGARMPIALLLWLFSYRLITSAFPQRAIIHTLVLVCTIGGLFGLLYMSFLYQINSSGRFALWSVLLIENWGFLGQGFGATYDVLQSLDTRTDFEQPHNEFLRLYINHGLLGVVVSILFLVFITRYNLKVKNFSRLPYIVILIGFMLTDNILVYPFAYGLLIIGFMYEKKL